MSEPPGEIGFEVNPREPAVDVFNETEAIQERGLGPLEHPEGGDVVPVPGGVGIRPLDTSLDRDGGGLGHTGDEAIRWGSHPFLYCAAVKIGVGLPSAVQGTPGRALIDWARHAEELGFSSLGVVDRVPYDSYDPFASLSAAAAVTEVIGLATTIAIGPLRPTALLAKAAASLDALSGGRLTLGLSVGARPDDYEIAGIDHRRRGDILSRQLFDVRTHFEVPVVSPAPAREGGPSLLVGGSSDAAFARMARYADGYIHNGGPPRTFVRAVATATLAWAHAERPGSPLLWTQGYFALGDAAERGHAYMLDYYAFTGPFAERVAGSLLTTPQSVSQFVRGYREAGCQEMVLMPCVADLDQLDRLADVLGSLP
jgi:alkanesulfonate monooxygenase SsuD/methylene tetrahydromethanopterin reductase-like flavin-dependent oxidoreductase (luciferase family)